MTQLLGPQGTPGSPADFRVQERGLVWPSGLWRLRRLPDSRPVLPSGQGLFENPERPGAICVSLPNSQPHRNFFIYIYIDVFLILFILMA